MNKQILKLTYFLFLFSASGFARKEAATPVIVSSADAFLASLDAEQRKSVLYTFDDNDQRARWSKFPTGWCGAAGLVLDR